MYRINLILLSLLISIVLSCSSNKTIDPKQDNNISNRAEIARDKIQEGALLIDVRTREEFLEGHLPNAINIPHEELKTNLGKLSQDKDSAIVLYCRSGRRSEIAKNVLEISGYTDVTNGGGLEELKANQ